MIVAPEQCVILIGGLGTRLGALTADTPKPLLPIGEQPFLDELLWHVERFGFRRVLLLAGYRAEKVLDYVRNRPPDSRITVEAVCEPQPMGTAGAIAFAADRLDPRFLLLNGDSLFDFNWLDLGPLAVRSADCLIAMSLRWQDDASRFGVVDIDGERVIAFRERGDASGGLINGGVYLMSRDVLQHLPARGSLEAEVLPRLAALNKVYGFRKQGFFLDIGVPDIYAGASKSLALNRIRPALFLDRDGVLNVDHGYVHKIGDFEWMPGAIEAIKIANDCNHLVFLVSNQAGVARGYYHEADVDLLHGHVQQALRAHGAHIDDIRYCPYHPEGSVAKYAMTSPWRKPEPGMILDLMERWPIDRKRSLLVGDQQSDVAAAQRAGISGHLFPGGNVADFVAGLIAQ